MRFTYQSGQKPLAGFTIKRGIGHGGFGEVYFALSDAGKEVALKVVRANLDIELRGIHQCLNLKHPNLVHLYDLRSDDAGNHWLVMEHVAGESLNYILARHPQGVPADLACQWFAGLAAAVHCLHDHGLVHRDLKPANIFLEHGLIKVGDYGLCKFIGGSQRVGQTQSVGTVHYMAPEISTGNYNRQIDVYAAGVILYEMLSGQVPFDGETAGEILMKHLTTPPDLGRVPASFAPILDRALCKNPANRYASIGEMSKQIVAVAPGKIDVGWTPAAALPPGPIATPAARFDAPTVVVTPEPTPRRWLDLSAGLLATVLWALVLTLGWSLAFKVTTWQPLLRMFMLTTAATWAVLIPARLWAKTGEDSWQQRLSMMGLGLGLGLLFLWLQGYSLAWWSMDGDAFRAGRQVEGRRHPFFGALYPDNETLPAVTGFLGYFGLIFLVIPWWKLSEPKREKRFRLQWIFAAAFWGYMLLFLLPGAAERLEAFSVLVLTSVVCQSASAAAAPAPPQAKRLRLRAQISLAGK